MRWLSSLFETTKETTSTIISFLAVVAMLGGIGVGFGKWFSGLNDFQTVSFFIVVGALFLIAIILIINWQSKRDIEKIPDLIEKLDVLTSNFIDDFEMDLSPDNWKKLNKDYSALLGVDLTTLETALQGADKKKTERAFDDVSRAYFRGLNPNNKAEDALVSLSDMSSILDTYNVGLGRLKRTPQYKKLDKKIKSLQRKAPSAYISMKVNDYYLASERLYTLVLGTRPLLEQPLLATKLPAKVNAKKGQIRPMVDGQISNLISGVREAILKHKERNMEQKQPEQKEATTTQNRAQRRGGN